MRVPGCPWGRSREDSLISRMLWGPGGRMEAGKWVVKTWVLPVSRCWRWLWILLSARVPIPSCSQLSLWGNLGQCLILPHKPVEQQHKIPNSPALRWGSGEWIWVSCAPIWLDWSWVGHNLEGIWSPFYFHTSSFLPLFLSSVLSLPYTPPHFLLGEKWALQ